MKPIDKYIKSGRATKMFKLGKEAGMAKKKCKKIDYKSAWNELKDMVRWYPTKDVMIALEYKYTKKEK